MKKAIFLISIQFLVVAGLVAQPSNDRDNLENLLNDFLDGASVNDRAMHDRFWAEDLIYTSSYGERVTKEDIMNSLEHEEDNSDSEHTVYHAENTDIRIYGNTAIIAFKLIANTETKDGTKEQTEFYNTGTFLKREGEWKAVAWQATRIPED